VHQRHRQTDNRQTTDERPIAYSDREREFTFAKKATKLLPKLRHLKYAEC